MKKSKIISLLIVVVLVGTALAFKPVSFGSGSVYCTNICTNRVDYRIDPTGSVTAPCGIGVQPYVLTSSSNCNAVGFGSHFSVTEL